jgi:cytochrome c oxidase assembly protein subunit 15
MNTPSDTTPTPRWLHWWAVLTVCAVMPLLLLGAEVTTRGVGMADSEGFREPWHLLSIEFWNKGLVIEHSHRTAGWIVGACILVLCVGLWMGERRRWVRGLGVAVLVAVGVQGLLGGFRVQLHALFGPELALVHGCFAQIVFALVVSVALVTARSWNAAPEVPGEPPALRRWALLTALLLYGQIILGAIVRHTEFAFGPRLHLFTAVIVALAVVALIQKLLAERSKPLTGASWMLGILLVLQLLLGIEAWLAKFRPVPGYYPQLQPLNLQPELLRSLHLLVGAFLFSTTVAVTVFAHRGLVARKLTPPAPARHLGGATA